MGIATKRHRIHKGKGLGDGDCHERHRIHKGKGLGDGGSHEKAQRAQRDGDSHRRHRSHRMSFLTWSFGAPKLIIIASR